MIENILQKILEIDTSPVEYEKICNEYYIFKINETEYHCVFVSTKLEDYTLTTFMFYVNKNNIPSIDLLFDYNYPGKVKSTVFNILDDYIKNNNVKALSFSSVKQEESKVRKYKVYSFNLKNKYSFKCLDFFDYEEEIIFLLLKDTKMCDLYSKHKEEITKNWKQIKDEIERYKEEIIKNVSKRNIYKI